MKKLTLVSLFAALFSTNYLFAQQQDQKIIDSLLARLPIEKNDTIKLNIYSSLFYTYTYYHPEESLKFEEQALAHADKLHLPLASASLKKIIGTVYWRLGKFEKALKYHFDALHVYEKLNRKKEIADAFTRIGQDYADSGNYPEAKKYFLNALKIFEVLGNKPDMANIYGLLSWVNTNQGDPAESSKNNYAALKIYEETGDEYGAAIAMSNMAEDNILLGNYTEALKYYGRSIKQLKAENDKQNLSNSYSGIGKALKLLFNYPDALKNQKIALKISEEINDAFGIASCYKNIGDIYEVQGKYDTALVNYLSSAEKYKSVSNKQELAGVYDKIGVCYTRLKDFVKARKYFDDEYSLTKELDSKLAITNYYHGVEFLDSTTGNWKNAYFNFKRYITNHDSIYNVESAGKIMQSQMHYESDKKEIAAKAEQDKKEIAAKAEQDKKDTRQRTIRNSIASGFAGTLIFLVVVYRQRNKISKAKKRSDELLLNILPAETAEELKATGTAKAKDYTDVTVLFTDFKNFTNMSENLSAQELVNEINYCYSAFDNIITKYGIEKIKTIGDSYMCAAGLPVEKKTHAIDAVNAALEIRQFIEIEKQKRKEAGLPFFEIRIGLHSGPVVAGIVGIKKFAYDIWGDTVNIASRMESSGEIGKVNISSSTYELLKNQQFIFTYRGKIQAKNKGEIDMYFVEPI